MSYGRLGFAALAMVLAAGLGCSDGDDGHKHDHDAGHDAGQGPQCTGNEDPQAAGTKKMGSAGKFSIEIVSLDPVAHEVSNQNKLTIRVLDAADAPLDGASVEVEVHTTLHGGHPADTQPTIVPGVAPGEHVVSDISYVHAGPWKLDFTITMGSDSDTLSFVFCVAGPDPGHGMVACKGDEDPHTPGTKKAGSAGEFSIQIVSADPAAHGVSSKNQLTVKVLDSADMPVVGATVEVVVWT
ncbi:MAG: hypothetical protein MJD61_19955, partial [Proteobacteria bacterium]|nr:hypothetical protein [Pseudomonadota bacterium]